MYLMSNGQWRDGETDMPCDQRVEVKCDECKKPFLYELDIKPIIRTAKLPIYRENKSTLTESK